MEQNILSDLRAQIGRQTQTAGQRMSDRCQWHWTLTVHAECHFGVQLASLGHGPVPHDTPVLGAIIAAGGCQRQHRRRDGVPRVTGPRLGL
jgi:hypothetical protein